jgi:hypothetical protein
MKEFRDRYEYDLKNREDVRKLGGDLGREAAKEFVPLVANLDADSKFIFYSMYLAAFAGSIAAAGGIEMSLAVLDHIKGAVPAAVNGEAGKLN